MKNISFIISASEKTGLGHLVRSLSLAKMLDKQFNISFVVNSDDSAIISIITSAGYKNISAVIPDALRSFKIISPLISQSHIVVLDFYSLTAELQLSIKQAGLKLVCIDDLHQTYFYADAIINVSNSVNKTAYHCEPYTKLFLGTDYVLLRPAFLRDALKPPRSIENIDAVFINMGGSDAPNNTLKFLKALIDTDAFKSIYVVLGAVNPHKAAISDFVGNADKKFKISIHVNIDELELIKILSICQLAICPASGVSMELSAIGIGMITGYTANNQKDILHGLINNECAFNFGDFNALSQPKLTSMIKDVIKRKPVLNQMIKNQKNLIDGHSPERLRKIFETL